MNIVALDCGTNTGWATIRDGAVRSGEKNFKPKRGESPGMRYLRFYVFLNDLLIVTQPRLVVFEQAHNRGGYATAILNTMCGLVEMLCAKREIDYTNVHSGTLKKHATGSGRASKEDMIKAAQEIYEVPVKGDDEADALLILNWALTELTRRELDEDELEL